MDWLHCNVCYLRVEKNEDVVHFVTTNCGHVFCQSCAGQMPDGKCQQCGTACRIVPLDGNMPVEISIFFRNTAHSLKKALASHKDMATHLSGYQQAKNFQDTQREHLMAFLSSKGQRPQSPPGIVRLPEVQFQLMQQEKANDSQLIQLLQKELTQLKAVLNANRQKGPGVASAPGNHGMMSPVPGGSLRPPFSNHPNGSAMIIGQAAQQSMPSRILQSRASVYVPASSHAVQAQTRMPMAYRQGYVPQTQSRAQAQHPAGQLSSGSIRPTNNQQFSSRESVVGGFNNSNPAAQRASSGRPHTTTPYPGAVRQMGVRPSSNASDSSMRSGSTAVSNRSSGIARTVIHGPTSGHPPGFAPSRVSSGSSRQVAGPTYRASDSLVAKRYKV